MGNLIPQLRADINGKLVTRHVKDEVKSPQSRRAFAAPVLPPQSTEMSQKEIEKERPLKKVKKRKVPTSGAYVAMLRSPDAVMGGTIEMSDENVYEYIKTGLTMGEGVALKSIGVGPYEWQSAPAQGSDEPDGLYSTRVIRFNNEVKRIAERRQRFSDVGHRLELRNIPADTAAKCLENGLTMKALSGYLTEEEVCEIYSKNGYLKSNINVIDNLVDGVIPFEYFSEFGVRNLNNWEKNCPVYRELPAETITAVIDKAKNPHPGLDNASASETQLMKIAAEDSRVLDLRLPELMWHGFRTEKEGGVFNYEEAAVVDDFIHEVRSRGITDLTETPRVTDKSHKKFYPDSGDRDSRYQCGKILDWHNAGLSTDQIISGMQNRWNKEQAVSVYLEDTAASLADGIL